MADLYGLVRIDSATTYSSGQDVSYVYSWGQPAYISDLMSGTQWGLALGEAVTLSFSFPTANASWMTWYGGWGGANEPLSASALGATEKAVVREALQAWSDVANVIFDEVTETASKTGDLRFAYSTAVDDDGFSVAWAYYPSVDAEAGDVWMHTQLFNDTLDGDHYAFQTVLHEIGHALGLSHPGDVGYNPDYDEQYTLMSYNSHEHALFTDVVGGTTTAWYVQPDTPMLYDMAAIQYLYGANMTYHSGDDVYTFDPHTPFFKTLWDAGGNDTLSVANFTKGCEIDLNAGHFSSITIRSDSPTAAYTGPTPTYDGTDNLAIAFGVTIENALGGSGHDTLSGNAADNQLSGAKGNDRLWGDDGRDTLYGGSGNDTLIGGMGKDFLVGGGGQDVFDFNTVGASVAGNGRDVIRGFANGDRIDLSGIDADTAQAGDQAFSFSSGTAFTGTFTQTGQLYYDKTSHILYGNNDADTQADFSIKVMLDGMDTLSKGSLVL